jgi:hypothetical protein
MNGSEQRALPEQAIEAFYHRDFVREQTEDFVRLRPPSLHGAVVDMGGGCGFFAKSLLDTTGLRVRVVDTDPQSIAACRRTGIEAELGDALHPAVRGDEAVVCFNLILHHLVSDAEETTRALQLQALRHWHAKAKAVFVNEYIYESYFRNFSGWLIYMITKSRVLSMIGSLISRIVPSLRANTFGVGVRFRAHREWQKLFAEAGFEVVGKRLGRPEFVALPLRGLLIRQIRRDSFWLVSAQGAGHAPDSYPAPDGRHQVA